MGRRSRKRNISSLDNDYDDENDDSLERNYLLTKREQSQTLSSTSKSVCETNDNHEQTTSNNGEFQKQSQSEKLSKKLENDNDSQSGKKQSDEIQRLREKKRRKKERQKQKKKEALAASIEEEKQWKEDEKTLKSKQRVEKRKVQESSKKSGKQFITTHRGVQYCDIVVGNGPIVQDRKKVRVSYKLRAKNQTGKVLDSSSNFGFRMGKGEVIPGWEVGLLRMRQGGVRHLIVPPGAGYGNRNIGAGSGALLYFEIKLLSC